MKTLKTLQSLSKLGKVLSTIVFILSIVGAAMCAIGIPCLALIPEEGFRLGDMTIKGLVEKGELSVSTCYATMACRRRNISTVASSQTAK